MLEAAALFLVGQNILLDWDSVSTYAWPCFSLSLLLRSLASCKSFVQENQSIDQNNMTFGVSRCRLWCHRDTITGASLPGSLFSILLKNICVLMLLQWASTELLLWLPWLGLVGSVKCWCLFGSLSFAFSYWGYFK